MISREIQIHKQENTDAKTGNANLKTRKYHVHKQRNTDTQIGKYRYKNREIHFQKQRNTDTQREKHKHFMTKSARIWTKALDCKCFGWPCMRTIRTFTIY